MYPKEITQFKFKYKYNAMWVLMLRHDSHKGNFFTKQNVKNITTDCLYSRLEYIDHFRLGSTFEFLLEYPQLSGFNRWIQTSNPCSDSVHVEGFEDRGITWKNHFTGLAQSADSHRCYLDGRDGSQKDAWYFAIGSYAEWQNFPNKNAIPGPFTGTEQQHRDFIHEVLLWVRNFNYTIVHKTKIPLTSKILISFFLIQS